MEVDFVVHGVGTDFQSDFPPSMECNGEVGEQMGEVVALLTK